MWFAVYDTNELNAFHYWFHFIDFFFLISMFLKFITDFIPDGETEPTKDLKEISKRYLNNEFLVDFITILPLTLMFELKILYLLKTIRVINGIKMFNVGLILSNIKERSKRRREKLIKEDPAFAEDQSNDNNEITALMCTKNILRIVKLVVLLFNISYFVAMFWLLFSDVTMTY